MTSRPTANDLLDFSDQDLKRTDRQSPRGFIDMQPFGAGEKNVQRFPFDLSDTREIQLERLVCVIQYDKNRLRAGFTQEGEVLF